MKNTHLFLTYQILKRSMEWVPFVHLDSPLTENKSEILNGELDDESLEAIIWWCMIYGFILAVLSIFLPLIPWRVFATSVILRNDAFTIPDQLVILGSLVRMSLMGVGAGIFISMVLSSQAFERNEVNAAVKKRAKQSDTSLQMSKIKAFKYTWIVVLISVLVMNFVSQSWNR